MAVQTAAPPHAFQQPLARTMRDGTVRRRLNTPVSRSCANAVATLKNVAEMIPAETIVATR